LRLFWSHQTVKPSNKKIAMPNDFINNLNEMFSIIERRQYGKLSQVDIDVPSKFNWVRDVFEPVIVKRNAGRNMLEIVTAELQSTVLTYQQGIIKCNQLLNLLRRQKVQQGDTVFIMCGLHEGLWITYLAGIKGGLILIPAAGILSVDDIEYRFQKARPKVIITDMENLAKMEQALTKYDGNIGIKILLDGEHPDWSHYGLIESETKDAITADTGKNDELFWFFTSGTTGMPKVAVHTHSSYPLGHLTTAAWIGLKPGDRHYNISQPGWAKFAWSCVFAPLNFGSTIFVYKPRGRFIAAEQLKIIQDYKVTTLCAPPTALRLLIQEDLLKFHFSLEECVSAGEPLNAEIIKVWKDGTGIVMRDGYGQTESTCMICNLPGSIIKFGSMGKPTFCYDMIIADGEGNELPIHETGQIAVRTHPGTFNGIFKSYIGDEERVKEAFKHGLYYTGDKAYKDEDGYFWFVGRDDDVIKSSDYRIGPFEVESVLLELDEVLESAVIGSPHALRGQEVKAFIVLAPGVLENEDLCHKIFNYCKGRLSSYKVPRIIEFVAELPKTISGKIRRIELRAAEEYNKAENIKSTREYFGR
jgi:acyl-coenzyme A synthetase/AMP-(fatty) acid ligase